MGISTQMPTRASRLLIDQSRLGRGAANPYVQSFGRNDLFRGRKDADTCGGSISIDMQQDISPAALGLDPLPPTV